MKTIIGFLILFPAFIRCGSSLEERQTYYENGQIKEHWTVKLDSDKNYLSQGEYVAWYENGQKMQLEYWRDGRLNGDFITWHDNGMKHQEGRYVDGEMDCLYREWNPLGQKIVEGEIIAGKQEGKWTYWDEKGNIFKQEDYKNGELVE